MDLSWIPEATKEARLWWEALYDRSALLGSFVVIALVTFPFYYVHASSKFKKLESDLDAKVREARNKSKTRRKEGRAG